MNKTITQEDFDAEIKDLMESLDLTEEEAIEDAIKCYEVEVFFVIILCLHCPLIIENILSFAIA